MSVVNKKHTNRDFFKLTDQESKLYRNPIVLRELYHEGGLSLREIAEELDCSRETIRRWMAKHGIDRRDRIEAARAARRVERASFFTTEGYERLESVTPEGNESVSVQQLAVIAEGADPHTVFAKGNVVHHRNGISFDNRPANLEVVSRGEHNSIHSIEEWVFDQDLGCKVFGS